MALGRTLAGASWRDFAFAGGTDAAGAMRAGAAVAAASPLTRRSLPSPAVSINLSASDCFWIGEPAGAAIALAPPVARATPLASGGGARRFGGLGGTLIGGTPGAFACGNSFAVGMEGSPPRSLGGRKVGRTGAVEISLICLIMGSSAATYRTTGEGEGDE